MTNLEIANKILKVLKLEIDREDELSEAFKQEFDNDFIWYPLYLASTWNNDLQGWCEAVIEGKSEKEFFGDTENE